MTQTLADMRRDYTRDGLSEAQAPLEPFALFEQWFADAVKTATCRAFPRTASACARTSRSWPARSNVRSTGPATSSELGTSSAAPASTRPAPARKSVPRHRQTVLDRLDDRIDRTLHGVEGADGGCDLFRDAVQAQLTRRLTIPRFGAAESLNAGVATGILLDGWRRARPA